MAGIDNYQAQIEGVRNAAKAPLELKNALVKQKALLIKAVDDSQAEIEKAAQSFRNPAARAYIGKIRTEVPPILFRIAQEGIAILNDDKRIEPGIKNIDTLASQLSSTLETQKRMLEEYRKYEDHEKEATAMSAQVGRYKNIYDRYGAKKLENEKRKAARVPEFPLDDILKELQAAGDSITFDEARLRSDYKSSEADVQALYDNLWRTSITPSIETYNKISGEIGIAPQTPGTTDINPENKPVVSGNPSLGELAGKDTTGVIGGLEDIYKPGGLLEDFRKLDQSFNLQGSPEARKYFETAKQDVEGLLARIIARGKYLIENPAGSVGTGSGQKAYESGENIEKMGSELRTAINNQKAKLTLISGIIEKKKVAFNLLSEAYRVESSADVVNVRPFVPPVFIEAIDNALYGTDGNGGCMAVHKLLRNNTDLPKEFVQETLLNIDEKQTNRLLELKIRGQQQQLLDTEKLGEEALSKFVTVNEQKNPGDKPFTFTEAGMQLSNEQQQMIVLAIMGVREANSDQAEAATCTKATERYWTGKALFETGQFQEARASLEAFIREDLSAIAISSDPKLKGKSGVYEGLAKDILSQIDKVDGANKDFFDAQELAQAGDIIGAKKLLKKYLAEHKVKKEGEADFTGSAKELLKRIALVQVRDAREKFNEYNKRPPEKVQRTRGAGRSATVETVDNPAYIKWQKYSEALGTIERDITSGKYTDFTDAYNAISASMGGFDSKDGMNTLADQLILDNGRAGLLELARKYREMGKNFGDPKYLALAEQYFQEYFSKKLGETAQKYVTIEELRKKYHSSPSFHAGITDKVGEAKRQYDDKAAKDPEWAQKKAWDEKAVRTVIENQAFAQMQHDETIKMQNSHFNMDASRVGDTGDQAAWGEFMNMKGLHGQGTAWEPFALSDEQVGRLVKDMPVDIAMIAASGALAAVTGGAASGVLFTAMLSAAERQALKAGARFAGRKLLAGMAGFAVETAMFTASHSVMNSVRTGELSIASFDQFMVEWGENVKVLGMLGLAGRASAALRLGRVSSLGVEMATMGTMHGQLTVDDFALILGLKLGHALPKAPGKAGRILAERKAKSETKKKGEQVEGPEVTTTASRTNMDTILTDTVKEKANDALQRLKKDRPEIANDPAKLREVMGKDYDLAHQFELMTALREKIAKASPEQRQLLESIDWFDLTKPEQAEMFDTMLRQSQNLTETKIILINRYAANAADVTAIIRNGNTRLLDMLSYDVEGLLSDYTDKIINEPKAFEALLTPEALSFIEKNIGTPDLTKNLLERIMAGPPDRTIDTSGKEIFFYPEGAGSLIGHGGVGQFYRVAIIDPVSGEIRKVGVKLIRPEHAMSGKDLGSEVSGAQDVMEIIKAERENGNNEAADLFASPIAASKDKTMIFYEIVDFADVDGSRSTESLFRSLNDANSSPESIMRTVHRNARALSIMHDYGYVHGDYKSDQSFRSDDGGRLGDFGSVVSFRQYADNLTTDYGAIRSKAAGIHEPVYLGIVPNLAYTPHYSSGSVHETIRSRGPDYAWKADAYALGCTIEEAITGQIAMPAAKRNAEGRWEADTSRSVYSELLPAHPLPDAVANDRLMEIAGKLKDPANLTYTVADATRDMQPYIE